MGMKKMSMKRTSMKMKAMSTKKVAKVLVWKGRSQKTQGGLMKSALKKNKSGKIVSVKRSNNAMKGKSSKWIAAVNKARKQLKIKGFVAIKKGTTLYKTAKSLYNGGK